MTRHSPTISAPLLRRALTALWMLPLIGAFTSSLAEEYRLGTDDVIRVRVVNHDLISGDYRIDGEGTISLPHVGPVTVAGATVPELVERVRQNVQGRVGANDDLPNHAVTAEILEYRPFYVVGDVERSGPYPYRPGLTVLKALAMAGGFLRLDREGFSVRVQIANTEERLLQTVETLGLAMASRARLEAELSGASRIDFPAELGEYLAEDKLVATRTRENQLFQSRTESLSRQVDLLEQQKTVFAQEILAHEQQIKSKRRQLGLLDEELTLLTEGKNASVVPRTRILELERLKAQTDGDMRELLAFIARSQAEANRVNLQIDELRDGINLERIQGIKTTEDEITRSHTVIESSNALLGRARIEVPAGAAARRHIRTQRLKIVREMDGKSIEIKVDEGTPVLPGDVLRVPMRLP